MTVSSASGADESPKAEVSEGFAESEPRPHDGCTVVDAVSFQSGTLIQGRYELQEQVGVGGLCAVWSARHLGLDQSVALKFLKPELSNHAEAVSRFNAEARACFVLRSEHVVRVLDVDSHEGVPFIVMELLDGTDLRQVLLQVETDLDPAMVVDYALQVCEGLSAAHASGIVHRDIKPENLFLHGSGSDASIKVLDFGISQIEAAYGHEATAYEASAAAPSGTPPYMSPEQLSAAAVDARSDVWSLGCVLYELLTGTAPFDRDTVQESCAAVLDSDPPAVSTLRADLPDGLDELVARCLHKDPAQRYPDTAQLAAALTPYGSGKYDDYPARCYAQLTGERRSTPELVALRREEPAQPAAAALLQVKSAREAATTLARLLAPSLQTLQARVQAIPKRSVWLAVVSVCALWVLSWVHAQRSDEPHIVTPSAALDAQSDNARPLELEAASLASSDALPVGAAAAAVEQGKSGPKALEQSAKRRRQAARHSRYQRRHSQREPDVGF